MSDAVPLPGGVKVMLELVGTSPGPDVTSSVTGTLSLMGFPLESTTVTSSHASCVPSTVVSVVVLDVSVSPAGVPEVGQARAGTLAYALRYP